ncbi:hypothetical protein AA0111_g7450 [Alternaria arborescens]|uniref:hypothetical protein n=1 Tax=Alternaria arborescens TaxID=156630 RepID=UPI0010753248|nr:hypothetical protein AA0111_g7450 [Alternaria arborescens]RYO27104.1 hypothetical protein AA0111_g7450 [Alternaria arborescens]
MAPTAPAHDYYVTLEVPPTAPHDEIKASYRRLARLHHPDKNIGCQHATAKTQLINAAWEILGDVDKRVEYDRSRPQPKAPSSGSRPGPQPTSTQQPRYQASPRPDTTAQDEARAQAESDRKRREWLEFERYQMEQIRRSRNFVEPLVAEIDRLNAIIDEDRTRLANDVPYAWNVFAFLSKRLSDQEKSEIRLASINADNAIRIKQIPLNKATAQLNQLCDQLAQRRVQEEKRIAAEKAHKANMERLARERAYEARRQEQARQQAERNKAAQEAAERFRQQQAEQARESAERARKERAAWEAILKACQEEEEAQERLRKQEADKERTRRSNERNASFGNCDHRCWWNKVEGYHICAHCTRPLFKFAEQCPSCNTIACASCRHILKTGGVPSAYKNDGHWSTEHARRRNRRG